MSKEIRRRTDVVEDLLRRATLTRLVGAVPAEQDDEWTVACRCMGYVLPAQARLHLIESETDGTALPTGLTA
ncbi:hypothetical protein [Streptomyces sp. NPDC101165]|uniref:hypothetical protein n=1 Tax=Streptomyces sp. NPDC101165 TaxID=3366119 RepID=UPI003830B448